MSHEQLLDGVRTAWHALKDHYRVAPLIYTSARVWHEDLKDLPAPDLTESPLWLTPYPFGIGGQAVRNPDAFAPGGRYKTPSVPPSWGLGNWWIHQYQGDAKGLPGLRQVDMNRFNTMVAGATGQRVTWVQRRLGISDTGTFDAATEASLKAFQQRKSLTPDGIIDPRTFAFLCWSNPRAARQGRGVEIASTSAADKESDDGGGASYIRWLQNALNQAANAGLTADGQFRDETRRALQRFQKQSGLIEDGIPGPITLAALITAGASAGSIDDNGIALAPPLSRVCPAAIKVTVSGFHQYSNAVDLLPYPEQQKVQAIATAISNSSRENCQPVKTVVLIGYADRDPAREKAEPGFEQRVSLLRAQGMQSALKRRIKPEITSNIDWKESGAGSQFLVVPAPRTELERARNRRVDIELAMGEVPDGDSSTGVNVGYAISSSPTGSRISAQTESKYAGGASEDAPLGEKPLSVPFQVSVEQSVYAVARWINVNDDRAAAAAAFRLVHDPETNYVVAGKQVTAQSYEAIAKSTGKVVLEPGAVQFLLTALKINRAQLQDAADGQKKFGPLLDTARTMQFFKEVSIPLNPDGEAAQSRRARVKRKKLDANDHVLENPQVAQLYVTLLDQHAKPSIDKNTVDAMAKDGLDVAELARIIGSDVRRRLVTDYFTQGVVEYRQGGGADIAGQFLRLEECLLGQLSFGNPTAAQNQLRIGVGIPEQKMGLVYRPDNTLYYDSESCIPLKSFAGSSFRDPGFKASAREPGLFNIETISDPVLRDFFRILHDQYKTPTLILAKGCEAYWENNEEVNRRIRRGLPQEIVEHLAETLKILAGFLVWRAAAIAFERCSYPPLQAMGAGMEVLAQAAAYVLQVEFLGSVEETLVKAGVELAFVKPKDPAEKYDASSEHHLQRAADIIRPLIADAVIQLMFLGVEVAKTKMGHHKVRPENSFEVLVALLAG